ncbi:class I SAM-dependent methyltransferase [bacterium]|nr:class I SAM-dependent methyltransferase [bacterium]MBU1984190.1 class I SAM-dependent methyltransferase [bacterium]
MPRKKKFRRIEKTWDEFWAEFWRIRLIREDEATAWKDQQVVEFCCDVLGIRPGMTVLDLGCGAGFQARLFAERGIRVHGIDISPPLIRHARRLATRHRLPATFAVGDMRDFAVETPFDRVLVLGMSFGFGTDKENETALTNIFRATKPGGRIMLTGQHPYSVSNHTGPEWVETDEGHLVHRGEFDSITCRLGGWWELVCPDGTIVTEGENPESDGIRCYSPPEMTKLLADAGFAKAEYYGSWLLPPSEMQWFSSEMISVATKPVVRASSRRS